MWYANANVVIFYEVFGDVNLILKYHRKYQIKEYFHNEVSPSGLRDHWNIIRSVLMADCIAAILLSVDYKMHRINIRW